jgi:hypothetical protein
VEIKLRDIERLGCGVEGIVTTLYNGQMTVVRIPSNKYVYNAVIGRPGEQITPPVEVTANFVGVKSDARSFNEGIRDSAEITANADKGFGHHLKYFKPDRTVTAAVRVEAGQHGEYGWGVYFEQGRHRMVLAGLVLGSDEEAIWTACAECANFEPVPGQLKVHVEHVWTPDEFGFVFEEAYKGLEESTVYQNGSPRIRSLMEKFVAGADKFGQPFEWHGAEQAPTRANHYSYHAAASRRFRVSDGPDMWSQGPVVFVPLSSQPVAGTPPQSGSSDPSQEGGGRDQGRPGEAGTESSVTAPG